MVYDQRVTVKKEEDQSPSVKDVVAELCEQDYVSVRVISK
jgi:hypothetical protein